MISSRNKAHESAMIIIYDVLSLEKVNESCDLKAIISGVIDAPYEECDFYVREVVIKALKNEQAIIEKLTPYLRKWKWDRLAMITQSILLMSVAHFDYIGGVDKSVVIDVAVTLAKRFLDASDYKFINAILDNAL